MKSYCNNLKFMKFKKSYKLSVISVIPVILAGWPRDFKYSITNLSYLSFEDLICDDVILDVGKEWHTFLSFWHEFFTAPSLFCKNKFFFLDFPGYFLNPDGHETKWQIWQIWVLNLLNPTIIRTLWQEWQIWQINHNFFLFSWF